MSAKTQAMTPYLCNNGDVINFLLPLCRIFVEYIKLDICAKIGDHQRNNNKVMMEERGLMTDGLKKPMSSTVNGAKFYYDF